ncbi:hypothetical protein F4777DRAFT_551556 [Nemania sp. FL0916]|nr:hypothetical protein F4777DRAFT_551556 [Nemania sp. FL0916]
MREERAPATSSFEFLRYSPQVKWPAADSELHVTHDAFWSYCGPLLSGSEDLPPNFHEWTSAVLSSSLLPRLIPFLEFVNNVLRERGLDHYWLTIRATKATKEFDRPRWHTDDMFFSARGGGLRAVPRDDDNNDGDSKDRLLDLQTDWKLCASLLGPSTMFIPPEYQAEARKTQRAAREDLATDHECSSVRCIACAATSDAVREKLSTDLKPMGVAQAASDECAFFHIGQANGAVHSEPCMSGGDRIFVNVVPGREDELRKLTTMWGMNFPRSWW